MLVTFWLGHHKTLNFMFNMLKGHFASFVIGFSNAGNWVLSFHWGATLCDLCEASCVELHLARLTVAHPHLCAQRTINNLLGQPINRSGNIFLLFRCKNSMCINGMIVYNVTLTVINSLAQLLKGWPSLVTITWCWSA